MASHIKNMKTQSINLKELDNLLKLIKLESKLAISLQNYTESQRLQLERLETIKKIAKRLHAHRHGTYSQWYKGLDEDLKKVIKKYGKYG